MTDEFISLRPCDAVSGGGKPPEGRYTITNALFAMWDYGGTIPTAQPQLAVDYKNADDQVWTQYYSAGDHKNLAPSDDGKRLRKVGSSTGLNNSTNCFVFLRSLVSNGFPEDKLGNDISVIVGLDIDLVYEAVQDRTIGEKKFEKKTIAVIGKIHDAKPGEKAKPAAKGKSDKAVAAKSNGGSDATVLGPRATQLLTDVLKGTESHELDKKKITAKLFTAIPGADPDRAALLNLVIQDQFLQSLTDFGVLYDADRGVVLYLGD